MKISTATMITLGFIGFSFISCDDDSDVGTSENAIHFKNTTLSLAEDGGTQDIEFTFEKNATVNGQIILEVASDFTQYFNSVPTSTDGTITLDITKGDSGLKLSVAPKDNHVTGDTKTTRIRIASASVPFAIGTNRYIDITSIDDDSEKISKVNFTGESILLEELDTEGIDINLELTKPAAANSIITIDVESVKAVFGTDFTTIPAVNANGEILIDVAKNATQVSFHLAAKANSKITGELGVNFIISDVGAPLLKGNQLSKLVTFRDHELKNRAKGYTNSNGIDTYKRLYEYDEKGRLYKVYSESYTPNKTAIEETYYYDSDDRLVKRNLYLGTDIIYTWTNGRISKSEKITDGIVKDYTLFEYNEIGQIAGTVSYHRQQSGEFARGFTLVLLYFNDGNIYKTLLYSNGPTSEDELVLVSTKTYDHYSDETNHFPMVEILPNVISQKNLPGFYQVEENGTKLEYSIFYEFNDDGLPVKRTSSSGNQSQTSTYFYY